MFSELPHIRLVHESKLLGIALADITYRHIIEVTNKTRLNPYRLSPNQLCRNTEGERMTTIHYDVKVKVKAE